MSEISIDLAPFGFYSISNVFSSEDFELSASAYTDVFPNEPIYEFILCNLTSLVRLPEGELLPI